MTDVGDWTKPEVFVHHVLDVGLALSEGNMHLNGALAVADVVQFLFCFCVDVSEHGW